VSDRETRRPTGRRQTFTDKDDRDWSFADRLGDMISAQAPDETYRYVSAAAKDLLGYEPEELLGTHAYDHFHPDDVPKAEAAHRSALDGAPFTIIYRLRHKNNEYVWVETTNRIVADKETGGVVEVLSCTREVEHRRAVGAVDEEERDASTKRINAILAEQAITPVFQPIVELKSGRTIGYEALARFPGDPAHTPDRWFDDAWRVGLGIPLELLAVRVAAAALPRLRPGLTLSINASPPTVAAQGFLQCLGGDVHRVAVEITEHLQADNFEKVSMKLASLQKAGGQVVIDDFGAGYASLQHILKMNPEWIKLDSSLTERIGEDNVGRALVAALVSFTDSIGVRVIAEGIENSGGVEALRELGIRFGQGFHLGRPAPLDEAFAAG